MVSLQESDDRKPLNQQSADGVAFSHPDMKGAIYPN
jgi:hypothetical protein